MIYLCNGHSESMKRDPNMKDIPYSLTPEQFVDIINHTNYVSIIGHDNIANYLSQLTGKKIAKNRRGITLGYDDELIIVSLMGRLPEEVRHVEFKGRVNFTYKRFEKQTLADLLESETRIKEMIKEEA